MRLASLFSGVSYAVVLAGVCLFLTGQGTSTAHAQGKTLRLVVTARPHSLPRLCVGRSYQFWVDVLWYLLVPDAQVTLTSAAGLAKTEVETHSFFDFHYLLTYQPAKAGKDTITIQASRKDPTSQRTLTSSPRTFNARVVRCRYKVSLTSSGTYQAPSEGGTATATQLDTMDEAIIQLGEDGKYSGTGDMSFSQYMSFTDKSCGVISTTTAEGTPKVDIQGALDDSGETLTLATVFHRFSAGWTVTGCGGSNTTQNPDMGDLNGYLHLAKFDVAGDGGSFSSQLSFPGWSGAGSATVVVYPEEDQGSRSFALPAP